MKPKLLWLVATCGVLAISCAAILARYAQAPGVVMAFYRVLIASLVVVPLGIGSVWRRVASGQVGRKALVASLAAGLCLGGHFVTWLTSLMLTPVATSTALVATIPLWVALFTWLFWGMRPSGLTFAGIGLAMIGAICVSQDSFSEATISVYGPILAIIGAMFAAAYLLFGKQAQQLGLTVQGYVALAYSSAALFLLPLPYLFKLSYIQYSTTTFGFMILLALVPQLIGHTSFNFLMHHWPPTLVSALLLLEPLGASILAIFLLQELPSYTTVLGGVLLLMGVGITSYAEPKHTSG